MYHFYLSASLAIVLGLGYCHPSPSPVDLAPRACSTLWPAPIVMLDASQPDTPVTTGQFGLNRSLINGEYTNTVDTVITFNYIPDGATGCMLRITIPALNVANQIATATPDYSGGFQTDVWTVSPDPLGRSTWDHPPTKGQFVSTLIFPTAPTTGIYETYLWSGTCPQGGASTGHPYGGTLSFFFEASTWQRLVGDVRFINTFGGKQGLETIGFSLVYNC